MLDNNNLKFYYTDENNKNFIYLNNEQTFYYLNLLGTISVDYYNIYSPHDNYFVVIVFYNDQAIGCGAFREYSMDTVELKRVYVKEEYRNNKIGQKIVLELERIAKEKGYKFIVLETNINMPEAIRFYDKLKYLLIENYDPFIGISSCVCMKKRL
ncbi:GNAT family N-acetyltransferase [Methanobrevibacter curvatus]|uniref:Acetyltransferase (GNAT) family protein n=1 Tax=Methanobrevibacter curvatus TaxID=49547 RepID=A0A166C277_9EURY|nr:GNAT family N-acetyltransferase [Methanobrevibacter curvatus]KZX10767.1 acetyltransferase (GNAT) family protein [Methanobrevibacter curvatus]